MSNTLSRNSAPVREVLYEFSLAKEVPDAELLDDFVRRYPEHAAALTDFAIELVVDSMRRQRAGGYGYRYENGQWSGVACHEHIPERMYANRAAKEAAVSQGATHAVSVDNPFAMLDRKAFRQLAQDLNANSVFVCKLRNRQIGVKTISQGFLRLLAEKLKVLPDAACRLPCRRRSAGPPASIFQS